MDIASPPFLMAPPEVWHRDRISSAALYQMEQTWKRIWFPGRPIRIRALRNVYVAQEGLVLREDLTAETSTVRQHTKDDIASARGSAVQARNAGSLLKVQGDVVLCRRPGTANYGHWLLEMLPNAYFAAQHWNRPLRFMVQKTEGPMAKLVRETLARLGISDGMIIEAGREAIWVEHLILVEGLTDHGAYISPLVFRCLDQIAQGIEADRRENVFVSRGASLTRNLVGEEEISQRAGMHGFKTFKPGNAPFAEQVAVFKGAKRIVGVAGATLSNLAFALPGAEVIMLTPAHMPDTFFWFICCLRGLKLIDVRCRSRRSDVGNSAWDGALMLDPEDERTIFDARTMAPLFNRLPDPRAILELFDVDFYLQNKQGRITEGIDPLEHYCTLGWQEGRDPSPFFSTKKYLRKYPDVSRAGLNPLLHYVEHGIAEGRLAFRAEM